MSTDEENTSPLEQTASRLARGRAADRLALQLAADSFHHIIDAVHARDALSRSAHSMSQGDFEVLTKALAKDIGVLAREGYIAVIQALSVSAPDTAIAACAPSAVDQVIAGLQIGDSFNKLIANPAPTTEK